MIWSPRSPGPSPKAGAPQQDSQPRQQCLLITAAQPGAETVAVLRGLCLECGEGGAGRGRGRALPMGTEPLPPAGTSTARQE